MPASSETWTRLHNFAIYYPADPTPADKREAAQFIRDLLSRLSCPMCRTHALEYIQRSPPQTEDTYELQSWVWGFHNNVNVRLGRPVVTYEHYRRLYADELSRAAYEWPPR